MRRLGLAMATVALGGGCGLALSGAGDTGEAGDASPGSWAGPDATGGNNDSPSPLETDATMETGSVAIDASDVVDEGLVLAADTSPAEASPDGSCAGVFCNGVCTSETDCHACPRATLLCAATGTCAANCASCGTATTECYACDLSRVNPIGTCEDPSGAYCLTGSYSSHCACNAVADCPGATQVCAPPASGPPTPKWCYTCGEDDTMAVGACKGGGMCVPSLGLCR